AGHGGVSKQPSNPSLHKSDALNELQVAVWAGSIIPLVNPVALARLNLIGSRVGPCTCKPFRGSHGCSLANSNRSNLASSSESATFDSNRESAAPRQK